mgnify:CR=1 FL=1
MNCVQTSVPCILTDTHDAAIACEKDRHGNSLRTVINLESGLVYTDPRPSHDQVKKFYSEDYRKEYKGTLVPQKKHIHRAGVVALDRWRQIEPYIQRGARVLDAGAGGGELLYLLGERGCEARGIEPNKGYANYAIDQYGVDINVGCFEDVVLDQGVFDTILLFHVLEHLESPVLEIKRLMGFLKPGGTFVIEVPNVTYRCGYPAAKWHIGHLYNFNSVTLAATAIKAGMDIIEIKELGDGGNVFGVFSNNKSVKPYSLEGNFDKVLHELETHTIIRHLLSPNPYIRPLKRAVRSLSEKWAIRNEESGKEILDKLYGQFH